MCEAPMSPEAPQPRSPDSTKWTQPGSVTILSRKRGIPTTVGQLCLRRPWHRSNNEKNPDRILVMSKRNYKVYADIGPDRTRLRRLLSVVDTGAGPNFIRREELPPGIEKDIRYGPLPDICDANDRPLRMIGTIRLVVRLGRLVSLADFIICQQLAAPMILGADYCDRFVEAIRPRKKLIELDDGSTVPIVRRPLKRHPKLTPLPEGLDYDRTSGRVSPKVRAAETIIIPAKSQAWITVTTARHGLGVIQPNEDLYKRRLLAVANGVVQVEPATPFRVLVANFSNQAQGVVKNQVLATLLPHPIAIVPTHIRTGEVLGLIDDNKSDFADGAPKSTALGLHKERASGGKKCLNLEEVDLSHVDAKYHQSIKKMLHKYNAMWDGSIGEISTVNHHIHLQPGTRPIAQHPYRAGPRAREAEKAEVDRMLEAGVIEPAQSEWASPIVLVPKPDGSLRFCVDYRRLNAVTVKDTYPLPRMDECIDSLGDANIFTTLDCNSGYWQIPIAPEDRDKTAFVCHSGLFRYLRMPFGLTNAPATFQRTLDILLSSYKWTSCIVYLDDVIIFSKDVKTHLKQVESVLRTLHAAGVTLKLDKCNFFTQKVKYLGHILRPGTLSVDQARVASLRKAQHPRTQTELRSFLGLCNVYRRFFRNFSHTAAPLNVLLTKGKPEKLEPFGPAESTAFETLIATVTSPPILALPKIGLPYSLDTDSSEFQVGAALFQTYPSGERKPIGFWSRSLAKAERNYSVSEKECLALVWGITTLRPYLQGEHFEVNSDHSSLRWLLSIKDPSGRLMRWRLRLSEFDFEVKYRKGKQNMQADALSRLATLGQTTADIDDDIPCFTCETLRPHQLCQRHDDADDWDESKDLLLVMEAEMDNSQGPDLVAITPEELLREQSSDEFCRSILSRLRKGERPPFAVDTEGFLVRIAAEREQLVIPLSLQARVLHLSHYARLAGHPGGRRLYYYLTRYFYWPSMAIGCYAVARNCTSCAKNRLLLRKNSKKLQLFPPCAPLEFVSIDILGELIRTKRGHRFLLVITDRFSKLVRTVPLKRITAADIAKAFVTHWVFIYGPPVKVLSDNGKQFTSKFFQNVCRIMGIHNTFTTTYHPQANGQVERFNRTIISALRHYTEEHPKDWDLFTDALTYAYNTQVHRTTSFAPFELVLSRTPCALALQAQPTIEQCGSSSQYYTKWMSWLESLMSTAKNSMNREQDRYRRNFDQRLRRHKQDIRPGSFVFVRKEYSNKSERKHKLAPIADGPFRVISANAHTVLIEDGSRRERISKDRVESVPKPQVVVREAVLENCTPDVLPKNVTPIGLQRLQEPAPPIGTPINGIRQRVPALDTASSHNAQASGLQIAPSSHWDSNDNTSIGNPGAQRPPRQERSTRTDSVSVEEGNPKENHDSTDEYVLDEVVDHQRDHRQGLKLLVKWYGFSESDNTWEPIHHVPRSAVIRYFNRRRLPVPQDITDAQEG